MLPWHTIQQPPLSLGDKGLQRGRKASSRTWFHSRDERSFMSSRAEPRGLSEKAGGNKEGLRIPRAPCELWEHVHRRQAGAGRWTA